MCSMQNVITNVPQQQSKIPPKQEGQGVAQQTRSYYVPNTQNNSSNGNDSFVRQQVSIPQAPPSNRQQMTPQQYRLLQQQKSSQDKKGLLTWGLGIASSAVILLYFGRILLKDLKDGRSMKNMEKVVNESMNAADDIITAIKNCSDPVLKKAAANEYSKGFQTRSEKRIKDILALDKIKNTDPKEVDIKKAIGIMDKKIIGMDEAKEAILDFLMQYNYNIRNGIKNEKPLVLLLDGPAGVGKTTISEVLAEALGMHYKKISLAGAHGKSLIRGTEPQFVNAAPGGIANGQLEGGTRRVLYCLDEVDKAGTSDQHGNILDTLLSLFDDQAKFVDDHLDAPIDISQSIFVLTTNNFRKLSEPLQNRVRKIQINGYDAETKSKIAKLKLKNAMEKFKLDKTKVKVRESAYSKLAELTSDQGGRETTRNVDNLIKKIITKLELKENGGKPIKVDGEFVENCLKYDSATSLRERILNQAT